MIYRNRAPGQMSRDLAAWCSRVPSGGSQFPLVRPSHGPERNTATVQLMRYAYSCTSFYIQCHRGVTYRHCTLNEVTQQQNILSLTRHLHFTSWQPVHPPHCERARHALFCRTHLPMLTRVVLGTSDTGASNAIPVLSSTFSVNNPYFFSAHLYCSRSLVTTSWVALPSSRGIYGHGVRLITARSNLGDPSAYLRLAKGPVREFPSATVSCTPTGHSSVFKVCSTSHNWCIL